MRSIAIFLFAFLACLAAVDAASVECKSYNATLWLGDKNCKASKAVVPIKIKESLVVGDSDSCNNVDISGIKGSVRVEKDGSNVQAKIFLGHDCGGADGKPTVEKKGIVDGKCANGFKVLGKDSSVKMICA
ncbi:hypothetical protein SARC_08501 [Sphaeroforma arctica JP610]|uniref:Cyanovirin-N domain-containing protein n=1 Tax=Sphaeroforma arctica JP610 TaxID=667725 RepID=A0A0L0FQY0_9EUKA|nr:hypothetical protein SARC_08501 [Sphaeroforma arctica JP610]KNC79089.1 hypothetical protein SARC_08501 [Sphaeroforma arctica JP610]|eukprot:XP_014152991.1 hypothetical protein SARC_08501 [Sphaeroforma arctica JP610]